MRPWGAGSRWSNDRRAAARRRPRPGQAAAQEAGERARGDLPQHQGGVRWPTRKTIEVAFEGPVDKPVQQFARVLVAVGRSPNSAGLGLENTKVEVDPQGFIVVDRQQRTADPHILAIGDVAGEPMLAHKAAHEGKVAVEVLAGEPAAFAPRAIPAVVFTDPGDRLGRPDRDRGQAAGPAGRAVAVFPWAASGRAQSVGRTEGLTKWLIDPASRAGRWAAGSWAYGAGDLISEAVLAIEMGAAVRDLAESIHPHPTPQRDPRRRGRGLPGHGHRHLPAPPREEIGYTGRSRTASFQAASGTCFSKRLPRRTAHGSSFSTRPWWKLRRKTPAQRLAMVFAADRTMRLRLEGHLRSRHPDWDSQTVMREIARRMSRGTG